MIRFILKKPCVYDLRTCLLTQTKNIYYHKYFVQFRQAKVTPLLHFQYKALISITLGCSCPNYILRNWIGIYVEFSDCFQFNIGF